MDFIGFEWIVSGFQWILMDSNGFLVDPARTWKYKETFIYVTFRVIRNVTTSFSIGFNGL